jgi:hypothetical protein
LPGSLRTEASSCGCRMERSQSFPRLETNIQCDDIIGRDARTWPLNSRLAIRIYRQTKTFGVSPSNQGDALAEGDAVGKANVAAGEGEGETLALGDSVGEAVGGGDVGLGVGVGSGGIMLSQ